METPVGDGISSVPSGLETPDTIDLRKVRKDTAAPGEPSDSNRQLFTVLEQTTANVGNAAYGSSHKYVLPSEKDSKVPKGKDKVDLIKSQKSEKVDITLNPDEVEEMDTVIGDDLLRKKFEQRLQEKSDAGRGEDLSDMVGEQSRKKRKGPSSSSSSSSKSASQDKSKKYKDFKF